MQRQAASAKPPQSKTPRVTIQTKGGGRDRTNTNSSSSSSSPSPSSSELVVPNLSAVQRPPKQNPKQKALPTPRPKPKKGSEPQLEPVKNNTRPKKSGRTYTGDYGTGLEPTHRRRLGRNYYYQRFNNKLLVRILSINSHDRTPRGFEFQVTIEGATLHMFWVEFFDLYYFDNGPQAFYTYYSKQKNDENIRRLMTCLRLSSFVVTIFLFAAGTPLPPPDLAQQVEEVRQSSRQKYRVEAIKVDRFVTMVQLAKGKITGTPEPATTDVSPQTNDHRQDDTAVEQIRDPDVPQTDPEQCTTIEHAIENDTAAIPSEYAIEETVNEDDADLVPLQNAVIASDTPKSSVTF